MVTLFLDLGSHYKIHCSEVGSVRCVLVFLVAAQIKELDDQTCSKVPLYEYVPTMKHSTAAHAALHPGASYSLFAAVYGTKVLIP
jgi:hypothetical protein